MQRNVLSVEIQLCSLSMKLSSIGKFLHSSKVMNVLLIQTGPVLEEEVKIWLQVAGEDVFLKATQALIPLCSSVCNCISYEEECRDFGSVYREGKQTDTIS